MFNTTHLHNHHKTERVIEQINEHKAPTDESIRLFKEFREKAFEEVKNGFIIQDNTVRLIAMERFERVSTDLFGKEINIIVDFLINKERVTINLSISHKELKNRFRDIEQFIYELSVKKFSEELAKKILNNSNFYLLEKEGKITLLQPWEYEKLS